MYNFGKAFDSKLLKWLENKVAGHSGFENEFWMNHVDHKATQESLFNHEEPLKDIDVSSGVTAKNMVTNYIVISRWLEKEFRDNQHKFETFCFYLLQRVVLINLSVEQTDVPMVFEVINDRGVRLKPYEILKGKLLGQISKEELEKDDYNGLWEGQVTAINEYFDDEIDEFFRHYLRSKLCNSRKEGQRFDGDYHREIFSNGVDDILKLKHDPIKVKTFLNNEFKYFTSLHAKVLKHYSDYHDDFPNVYFNRLNDLDGQFMLIHSSCETNDSEQDDKIKRVSFEFDRLFSLLQLQNAYDSNKFTEISYDISAEIRNKDISEVRSVFDSYIIQMLKQSRGVSDVDKPLQYKFFRATGINLNMRFKRYFFARIEEFLSKHMNLKMKHFVGDLVSKTGAKTGFHIEHILSNNDENLGLFHNDQDRFEQERNRLGGLLLLKGKDNISSSNEVYIEKLKTYANTLYWNETLRQDSYKSKKDILDLKNKFHLELEPYNQFGQEELEKRHRLLFQMVKIIWDCCDGYA